MRSVKINRGLITTGAAIFFMLGVVVSPVHAELPKSVALLAGQNIWVGFVDVQDDGGNIKVTYSITEGSWCLQHVHAHAAEDETDIPRTRRGNPIPGRFQVNEPVDCETSKTVTLGEVPDGDFVVAAHAVVATTNNCQDEGVLFGTERDTGMIKEIDAVSCNVVELIDTLDPAPGDMERNSPNGLAFDEPGNTLYFSVNGRMNGDTPERDDGGLGSQLWAADLATKSVNRVDLDGNGNSTLGTLEGHSASGMFFIDDYWYMENQSDRLKRVALSDPLGGTENPSVCDIDADFDLSGDFRFGDIVVAPGTTRLFASTNGAKETVNSFVSLDLDTCSGFKTKCTDPGNEHDGVGECADQQQLAYGSNGVLYGHPTASGQLFVIDTESGLNSKMVCKDIGFYTDLASGPQCSPEPSGEDETAWGDGERFVTRGNWATFIQIQQ